MQITHKFVSQVPPAGLVGDVTTTNWNDTHVANLLFQSFAANGNADTVHDVILGTSGGGTVTITLPAAAQSAGVGYYAMKVDSGAGVVSFVDASGNPVLLAPGAGLVSSYELVNQGQWVRLICDGTYWYCFGV